MATNNKRPPPGAIDNRDAKRQNTGAGKIPEREAPEVRTNYWPVEILTNKIFKYHFEFVDERIIEDPAQLRKIIRCTFDYMKMPRGTSRFVWGNSLFTLNALPTEFIKTPIEIKQDERNNIPACSIVISGPDAFDFESTVKGMQRASRHAGNQEYEMVLRKEGSFVCQIINILFKSILKGMGLTSMGRQGYFNVGAGEGNDRNVSFMPGFNPVVVLHNNKLFLHTDFQYRAVARDNALRHVYNTDPMKMQGQSVFCEHNKRHYIVSSVRRDMTPNSTFDLKDGTKQSYADYYQSRYGLRVRDFKQPMLEVTQRSKEGVKSIYLVPEFCKIAGIPREELKNTRLPTTSTVERHQKLSRFITDFMTSATRNKFSTVKVNQQFYNPGAALLRPQMIKFYGTKQHRLLNARYTWDELLRTDSDNKMLDVQRFPWTIWVTDRSLEADARNFYDTFVKVMRPLCQNGIETPNWIIDDYRNINVLSKANPKPAVVVVVLATVDATMYNSVKRDLMTAGISGQIIVREKFMKGRFADMSKVTKAGLQILTKAGGILWTTTFEPEDVLGHKLAALHTCVFGIERSIGRRTGATTKIAVTCTVDRDPSRFSEYFNYHAGEAANSMPSLQSIVERGLNMFKTKNQRLPGRLVFYSSGASEGSLKAVLANDVKEVKSAIAELYKGQPQPEMLYVLLCRGGTTRLFAEEKGFVSNVKPGTLVEKNICAANEFYLVSHDAGQKSVLAPKYILAHHDEPDDKQKVTFTMKDLQRLSFGLCHLYYNWPGPISCPAPLKYADKLAKLASAAMLPSRTDNALATKLFYI